jgi:GTP-dependent dephospho-CoA kinase
MLIPDALRARLKGAFGPLAKSDAELIRMCKGRKIAAVGDTSAYRFLTLNIRPGIAAFDFRTRRAAVENKVSNAISAAYPGAMRVVNPAGTLTEGLAEACKSVAQKGEGAIFVDGEEDMAALVLMAELGSGWVVAYGQPDEGIAVVKCMGYAKRKAKKLLLELSSSA